MTDANLSAAVAAREAARAKLEAAVAALARGRGAAAAAHAELARLEAEEHEWIARDARRRVERAISDAGPAPALIPTDKAFIHKRKAELTLAAELQAVASLEAAEREAREVLAAAEAAAREAAREVLHAEIRAEFESFRRQASAFAATRERLFGAFLGVGRAALTSKDWLLLDTEIGASSDVMGIGSAWLDIPIDRLEQTGAHDRPAEARRRIDSLIPLFEARLAELAAVVEPAEPREEQNAA